MRRRQLLRTGLAAGASLGLAGLARRAAGSEAWSREPMPTGAGAPSASSIMIIRHAEKPAGDQLGVDTKGRVEESELTVRGWQRAGALVCLFAPTHGPMQHPSLAVPKFLFASLPKPGSENGGKSKSRRPASTIEPLAAKLGMQPNLEFSKGQEQEVARAAMACAGPVLISWQHESIPAILRAIPGGEAGPQSWPGERFDVVYVLTWDAGAKRYRFSQVPQRLLAGDLDSVIAG